MACRACCTTPCATGACACTAFPKRSAKPLTRWAHREAALEGGSPPRGWAGCSANWSGGVPALILKGTALAYSTYRHPHLRPRADIDLLVPEDRRGAARAALAGLGYEFANAVSGRLVCSGRAPTGMA